MNPALVFILLLGLFAGNSCAPNLVKPDLSLREVELTGASFSSIDLAFVIKLDNPNRIGIRVDELSYELDLNEVPVGSGKIPEPVSIGASSSQLVTLPFTTPVSSFSQLMKMILGDNEVHYKLKGSVTISKLWARRIYPFESQGVVPLNRSTFHH